MVAPLKVLQDAFECAGVGVLAPFALVEELQLLLTRAAQNNLFYIRRELFERRIKAEPVVLGKGSEHVEVPASRLFSA